MKKQINLSLCLSCLCLAFLVILAGGACQSSGKRLPVIKLQIKGETFNVEVARSEEEQQLGLMFRKQLGEREGMIFVYTTDQQLSFWMKNTEIPLSIAFLSADGTIIQIEDMQPFDPSTIRSRISVRHALEVKQGVLQGLGVKEGDKVVFPPSFP